MNNSLKIALYAASEGGKTLQVGNLIKAYGASNVGIISCEGGLSTIHSLIKPEFVKECASLDDVRTAWGWAAKTFTRPDQFVCVDGGSRVLQWIRDENWGGAEAVMEAVLEGRRRDQLPDNLKPFARFVTKDGSLDGMRIWVQVGTECERLFDAFIKLPCSVVWNFWEELTSMDQYTKGPPWKPDTPGNGAFQAIKRSFDYVFRLTRDGEMVVAQCANTPKAYAKRRDDWSVIKVQPEIKPFDLAEFVELVRGAQRNEAA